MASNSAGSRNPSRVLGAFFLHELDERLGATGLFYVRFMDDVVVLTPTRWQLRRAIAVLNRTFALLGLEKQRAKTFIGRVERGFDFLGVPRVSERPHGRRGDASAVRRTGYPALRARGRPPGCGGLPWVVRATLGRVGVGRGFAARAAFEERPAVIHRRLLTGRSRRPHRLAF